MAKLPVDRISLRSIAERLQRPWHPLVTGGLVTFTAAAVALRSAPAWVSVAGLITGIASIMAIRLLLDDDSTRNRYIQGAAGGVLGSSLLFLLERLF